MGPLVDLNAVTYQNVKRSEAYSENQAFVNLSTEKHRFCVILKDILL